MTGDLITKKLPKYKLEAMERIAYLCFKEISISLRVLLYILLLVTLRLP